MKYLEEFRDSKTGRVLVSQLNSLAVELTEPVYFMEVCGTHTMAIHRNGIRSVLPENLKLISGPGCPVCV